MEVEGFGAGSTSGLRLGAGGGGQGPSLVLFPAVFFLADL